MSEAKPVAPVEAVAPAEPTPAATEAAPAAEAATETEAKPEEAAKATEETPASKEVTPIYEGKLSYNPGGNPFTAIFGLKKEYVFFFGEEAVPSDKLAHLIKPGKADLKETVAWSSETGKGLLYFAKHADQKDSPKGVIALADVDEVKTAGPLELTFKAHGHKHSLIAESHAALKGWEASLKEKIEEAKLLKNEIIEKSGYKETLEKLSKPAVAAAVIAKTEAAPKKSSDSKSVERAARSSEATDKARPSIKERSQSRSKKLLSQLRGKKEVAKEEVKAEEAKESAEVPAAEAVAAETTETPVAATEEAATAETAPAETEEPKDVKKEKQARRGSKFLDKIRGMASPTSEKKPEETSETKEAEATPAVTDTAPTVDAPAIVEPAKETEPVAVPEPAVQETPAASSDKAEEPTSPTTAAKEEKRRSSFFGAGLSGITSTLRKASQSGEKKPKVPKEEKAVEDAKPEDATAEESKPAEDVKPTEPTEDAAAAAETGPEVPAKDAEVKKEKKENKFIGGIQRSLSKALRKEPKEKKAKPTTEKLEEEKPTEEVKATEAAPAEVAKEGEPKKEETASASAPNAIGDVVPEAVHTGAPPASQTVSATA